MKQQAQREPGPEVFQQKEKGQGDACNQQTDQERLRCAQSACEVGANRRGNNGGDASKGGVDANPCVTDARYSSVSASRGRLAESDRPTAVIAAMAAMIPRICVAEREPDS